MDWNNHLVPAATDEELEAYGAFLSALYEIEGEGNKEEVFHLFISEVKAIAFNRGYEAAVKRLKSKE